jgi:hypothetical protein
LAGGWNTSQFCYLWMNVCFVYVSTVNIWVYVKLHYCLLWDSRRMPCSIKILLHLISWIFYKEEIILALLTFVPLTEYWQVFPHLDQNLTRRMKIHLKCTCSEEFWQSPLDWKESESFCRHLSPLPSSSAVLNMYVLSHRDNWDLLPGSFFPLLSLD